MKVHSHHPLVFERDGQTIGQFYNSKDRLYHLAQYVPYSKPPEVYLCGKVGNFSPSGSEYKREKCAACWVDFVEYTENGP